MEKKKTLLNVSVIIICVLIVIVCVMVYKVLTKKENSSVQIKKEEVIDFTPIINENEYPIVDGSTATIPLAKAFKENFTGIENAEIKHSKTHNAYVKLIDKECDLILVVEPSEEDVKYAEEKNVELIYDKIVNEGFVFFVNKNNPVDSLTIDQIQKIYTGEITNWKEVGGKDEEIKAYQRPENSGSQNGMLSLVMKGKKMKDAPVEDVAVSMADIIDVVSNYANESSAIGYSYYYYANTMYISDDVKMIKVNGVEPNNETIKSEKYPFLTAYYVVSRNEDEENSVEKVRKEMLSTRGQKVVENAGYVPVK